MALLAVENVYVELPVEGKHTYRVLVNLIGRGFEGLCILYLSAVDQHRFLFVYNFFHLLREIKENNSIIKKKRIGNLVSTKKDD